MNKHWEQVREFHLKFNHPAREIPTMMEQARAEKRYKWMKEEIDEFLEAEDKYEQADAMIDLIYFALGTLVEMGTQPEELFNIVHGANMAKLWPDGKPHYNEDGKTIKPSTWRDPYPLLKAAVDAQAQKAADARAEAS